MLIGMHPITIVYTDAVAAVTASDLADGFFDGWPSPPSRASHLKILQQSYAVILAYEPTGKIVGFISAISDGISCAYIPFLEVVKTHQHLGIGTQLMRRMLERLKHLYMVDLSCDEGLVPFYGRFSMLRGTVMMHRNYVRQACD